MKYFSYKKIISGLLIFSMLFSVASLSFPEKAEAQWYTFDGATFAQSTLTAINTTSSTFSTYSLQLKAFVLDTLATTLAKQLIRTITADVVNWINSGFEGSPAFISNPGGFFVDVADQVTGAFLAKYGGPLTSLCSPFSIDIRLALSFKYHPNIPKRYECTLSKIITNSKNAIKGATINGFAAGDFRQGGWPAFVSMTTEPQNNVYGAYLEADSELSIRVANAQISKKDEVNNGKGFLSWRDPKCTSGVRKNNAAVLKSYQDGVVDVPTAAQSFDVPNPGTPNTTTGTNYSNAASAIDAFSMGAAVTTASTPEATRNAAATSYNSTVTNVTASQSTQSTFAGGDATAPSIKSVDDCPIQTPGSLIEGTLLQHIGGPTLELELVDSINQIVNALASRLVTTVLQKGLSSVSGSGPSDSTAYLNQIKAEADKAEVTTSKTDLLKNVETYLTNTLTYKTNKDQSLNLALETKLNYSAVTACYTGKIHGSVPPLQAPQVAQAEAKIAEVDAIINTTIAPLAGKLLLSANEADARYKKLDDMKTEITAAKTVNDLNAPSTQFSLMVQSQSLTSPKDIADSQTELDATKTQVAPMKQDATRRLQECQIFPYSTGQVMTR